MTSNSNIAGEQEVALDPIESIIIISFPVLLFIGMILYLGFFGKFPRHEEEKKELEEVMQREAFFRVEADSIDFTAEKELLKCQNGGRVSIRDAFQSENSRDVYFLKGTHDSGGLNNSIQDEEFLVVRIGKSIPEAQLITTTAVSGIAKKLFDFAMNRFMAGHLKKIDIPDEELSNKFLLKSEDMFILDYFSSSILQELSRAGYFIISVSGKSLIIRHLNISGSSQPLDKQVRKLQKIAAIVKDHIQ